MATTTSKALSALVALATVGVGMVSAHGGGDAPDRGLPRADPAGDAYYATVREAAQGLDDFTVYRPDDLESFPPGSLPVVLWGNGGCDRSNLVVSSYLQQIAAEGYVVVADGGLETPPDVARSGPEDLVTAMDWALESKQARRQFKGRIDEDKVATMGRSCGGLQALRAGQDDRVGSVVVLHSGFFPEPRLGYDIAELQNLEAPTLFANGGPEDSAYENSRLNFELAPVPSALVEYSVGGHFGVTHGLSLETGEIESDYLFLGVQTSVNWLDWTLNGDQEAKGFFVGPDCGPCAVDQWSVETKGLG